jgi:ribosome-associated protein
MIVNHYSTDELLSVIFEGVHARKGHELVHIDLRSVGSGTFDNFVICHGDSNIHADAIAESVEQTVQETLGIKPWHREGHQNAQWIILAFDEVIVHVFQKEFRTFYNLEDLWADAKIHEIADETTAKLTVA